MRHSRPRLVAAADPDDRVADPDDLLEDALRSGRPWAEREVLDRFTGYVRRVLIRILGSASDIDDLTQEVFIRGLDRVAGLRPRADLRSWFASFAVNVARETLRARARRRWLVFLSPTDLPDVLDDRIGPGRFEADTDANRALRASYEVLDGMRSTPRTLFALRHIEGMELAEVAAASRQSIATVKRRLARAEAIFYARARRHPVLRAWLEEEDRWRPT